MSLMRRRGLMMGLAVAGCSPMTDGAAAAARAGAGLGAFHGALAQLEAGRRQHVAVLQIGDSHTANDGFSGRMRELFQARFGAGGRGLLPPAIPFRYYRPSQVTVTADGWRLFGAYDGAPGPFGLALVRQRADGAASMVVRADEPGVLDLVAVDALGQPRGGTIDVAFDTGQRAVVPTDTRREQPLWVEAPVAAGASMVTLTTRGDGPVELFGVRCLSSRKGVTWSNLGTIGATVGITARWDHAVVASEMKALDPKLVVLAFGTNEGFKDSTDPAEYRALYRELLRALRAMAPGASVAIALPPDGVRRLSGTSVAACPSRPGDRQGFAPPPQLTMVRETQRRIAASEGLLAWDWSAAMGGDCSIMPMSRTDPPQAAPDLVHLFRPGYRKVAEPLFDALMQGYRGGGRA